MVIFEKIAGFIGKHFPEKVIRKIDIKLEATGLPLSASEYLGIVLIALIIVTPIVTFFNLVLGLITPIAIVGVTIFLIPLLLRTRRVAAIERALPEVFHEMALTLKAGIAMEGAIDDIASADYGPISEEFRKTLLEIRRGRSVDGAFIALAKRVESENLRRAMSMVISGMKMGASLSDVLEAISSDIRETRRIERERAATTMMQVMFILVASAIVAPAAIGIIASVTGLFAAVGGVPYPVKEISTILLAYSGVQGVMSGLLVGVVRYGRVQKGLKYAIPLGISAVAVYTLTRIGVTKYLGIGI